MPKILPAYKQLVAELSSVLDNLPGIIIGIDGRNGVGKTTLGRYLAWHFNVSLVESDLFLNRNENSLDYRLAEIVRIIDARLEKPRPVILDGILLRELLQKLNRSAGYVVYCRSGQYSEGNPLEPRLLTYETQYKPQWHANMCVDLEWGDI